MLNNRFFVFLSLAVCLFFASCDSSVLYNHSCRISDDGWNASDELLFNVEASDTTQTYLCCIDLRNGNDYPFSNIYFSIKTVFPDGSVAADTNMEFMLAEPDGRWLGKQTGSYVDGRYPFGYFRFPQTGQYQFVITHAMRDSVLTGIKNVGLHIERM